MREPPKCPVRIVTIKIEKRDELYIQNDECSNFLKVKKISQFNIANEIPNILWLFASFESYSPEPDKINPEMQENVAESALTNNINQIILNDS